jgi:hypothetical protein
MEYAGWAYVHDVECGSRRGLAGESGGDYG